MVNSNLEKKGDIISSRLYNLIIGGCLLWAFLLNTVTVFALTDWVVALNPLEAVIGSLPCFIIGVFLVGSFNVVKKLIGYNLIVLPFGLLLARILHKVNPTIVLYTIITTGVVTLLILIIASIFPQVFLSNDRALLSALVCLLVTVLIFMLFFETIPPILNVIVVLLFSCHIGYRWAKANTAEKTIGNAVDGAVILYLDILFLFARTLSISKSGGRLSSKD